MNDKWTRILTKRVVVMTLIMALLGYIGNRLAVPVAYSVEFIFGSIFAIIALRSLGLVPGILTAFLASIHTYYLWNHPYAIIIFTAEIIWIGIALRRGGKNLILIDTVYWLVLGIPLVGLFYYGLMDLGYRVTFVIMLKQSINGILNALAASILLTHTPVISWIRAERTRQKSTYSLWVFHLVTAFLMLPTLTLVLMQNYQSIASAQQRIVNRVIADANETQAVFEDWIDRHIRAVRVVGELGSIYSKGRIERIQEELAHINRLFPDFHNVFLGDTDANTLVFHPMVNEKGESTIGINFSDRRWFQQLRDTLEPVVSSVFTARGGVFEPIIAIAVPFPNNGKLSHFGAGAVNLAQMETLFRRMEENEYLIQTIVDRKGKVIASSDPARKPLAELPNNGNGREIPISSGVLLKVPESQENISIMSVWKDASYYTQRPIHKTSWNLIVEYPVGPLQKRFYDMAIASLGTIALIYVIMIGLATLLSRLLARPIVSLSRLSADIPEKIDRGQTFVWPQSHIAEVSDLIENYAVTAETLENKLLESRERYRVLVDISPSGIWMTDKNGEVEFVSSKWTEITGISFKDAMGKGWLGSIHPDDKERVLCDWFASIADKTAFQSEYRLITVDGKIKWVYAIASSINETDTISGWIGTITDITLRKERERIEASLQEKEILLQEIHHRVKNNMAVVSSLLRLQATNFEDERFKTALMDSQNRVQAMSLIHETLYQTKSLSSININSYLSRLARTVVQSYTVSGRIRLNVEAEDISMPIKQASPLGLIIAELISNSTKYAFPDHQKGDIVIKLRKVDEEIEITYRDNGKGMPEDLDWEKTNSLGLHLVRLLGRGQLDGTVDLVRDNGTCFIIRFKYEDS